MQFYELTHPDYETDHDHAAANRIQMEQDVFLPGMICPACGPWAGGRRLYLPVGDAGIRDQLGGKPVPPHQWTKLAQGVRAAARLSDSFLLGPGDILGTPRAELLSDTIPDFVHPFPGQLVVRDVVVTALKEARLTGFEPIRVEVRWSKGFIRPRPTALPVLYELVVTGEAWRVDMDGSQIQLCEHCGRTGFPHPEWLVVDPSRWDGTDFLNVDRNPNIVLVTQRACTTLARAHFSNYQCIPVL